MNSDVIRAFFSGALPQRARAHAVEHRLQLARRAGKQDHDPPAPLPLVIDKETGRGAVRVVEDDRAARHHRLAPVDLRHRQPAPLEAGADLLDDCRVLRHRQFHHLRHDVARQVVVGRAEAAGEHDHVGTLQRLPQHRREIGALVADDRLDAQVDPER